MFSFAPYNYGPFDKAVYWDLEALAAEGHAEIVPLSKGHGYRLTATGQSIANAVLLDELPAVARNYIKQVSAFVLRLSFAALVSAIYKAYPDMRVNSIFQH